MSYPVNGQINVITTAEKFCSYEATHVANRPVVGLASHMLPAGRQLWCVAAAVVRCLPASELRICSQGSFSAARRSKHSRQMGDNIGKSQRDPEHSASGPAVPSKPR